MFDLFLCFVKIEFTWLKLASTICEVGNASKNGSATALSLGYLVAVLMLLQYSAMFSLFTNALASTSACISISESFRSDS